MNPIARFLKTRRKPLFGWKSAGIVAAVTAVVWAALAEPASGPASGSSEGILRAERWSPYAVGIGIGILSWLAPLLSDNRLGASSAYLKTSVILEAKWPGNHAYRRLAYYRQHPPVIDWGWMLLLGIIVGAMLSAVLSGSFRPVLVPSMWVERFGDTPVLRWLTALCGGILLSFGARWAGGCTSGHGISGTLQLAPGSWVALLCFFLGGALTANALYTAWGF